MAGVSRKSDESPETSLETPSSETLASKAFTEEGSQFTALCGKAEKTALNLIARAEQTCLGLAVKLQQRGFDGEVVKEVISRLSDRNLLNDERFAELWTRSRIAMGKVQSPRRLLISLAKRGIKRNSSLEAIKSVLDPEEEYALLLKYLERTEIPDANRHLRLELKNEGFSPETISRFFDSI